MTDLDHSSPTLAELRREARPGRCPLCDGKLPRWKGTGRKPKYCHSADCRTAYEQIYQADRRKRARR